MSYLNDLLARVVALEKEAMSSLSINADAVPYFNYAGSGFPYFTNRIADTPITNDGSEDIDLNNPLVIMRFVVGHATEGYKGEIEAKLYTYLPAIKTYIQQRSNWLQSAAYPTRMDNLQSARISNAGGLRVFQNEGINSTQVGAELQLACIFDEVIEQVYY
jgi:hypothetical protein